MNTFLGGGDSSFMFRWIVIGALGGRTSAGWSSISVSVPSRPRCLEEDRLWRVRSGLDGPDREGREDTVPDGVDTDELSKEYSATLCTGRDARRSEFELVDAAEPLTVLMGIGEVPFEGLPLGEDGRTYMDGGYSADDCRETGCRDPGCVGPPIAKPINPALPVTVHLGSWPGAHVMSQS